MVVTMHSKSIFHKSQLVILGLASCAGCADALPEMTVPGSVVKTAVDASDEPMPEVDPGTLIAKTPAATSVATSASMPSPGRTNPFELSSDFQEQAQSDVSGGKRDIRVAGFVDAGEPVVMLLIDGKSHSFKKGETHLRITVNEISPPRVRLTYDNVTWNASLFDRHEKL